MLKYIKWSDLLFLCTSNIVKECFSIFGMSSVFRCRCFIWTPACYHGNVHLTSGKPALLSKPKKKKNKLTRKKLKTSIEPPIQTRSGSSPWEHVFKVLCCCLNHRRIETGLKRCIDYIPPCSDISSKNTDPRRGQLPAKRLATVLVHYSAKNIPQHGS